MLTNLRALPSFFLRPLAIARDYRLRDLRPDLIAGVTVAIISLPQAIAYALVAGLPPQMGLYAAIVIPIVAALWGSSCQVQSTPTTALSLLVLASLSATLTPNSSQFILAAGLLAVLAGLMQLALGLARLGILVNFVSDAVIVGFAAGAGVQIAAGELRHLFGLSFQSGSLVGTVEQLAIHVRETQLPTLGLGLGSLAVMVLVRRFRPKWPAPLICLVLAAVVLFALRLDAQGVKVIGALPRSLPPFTPVPLFDLSFVATLAPGALAIAALGLIQTMAIARTLATQTGERLDNNQEFVGQGLGNIATGFLSGYPGGGSISCSAINAEAGAQTPVAAILSGVFTLVGMLALAPLGAYLPRAALSGVLVVVGYAMIDRRRMLRMWRSSRSDAVIMLVTLLATLFLRIDFAVLAGILMSLAAYLLRTSTPRVVPVLPDERFRHFLYQPDKPMCPQLGILDIAGDLYFGAVSHVEEVIRQHRARYPGQRFLLLRMHSVDYCDISGIRMLESVLRLYRSQGGDVFMVRVGAGVRRLMAATGFAGQLGDDHFLNEDGAIEYLFTKVLDPAICIYESGVRIFRECQNLPRPDYPIAIPLQLARPAAAAPAIAPPLLWQQLRGPAPPLVIDVREPREFQRGHIPQAQLIPLPTLLANPPELPPDRPIVLVCRGGRRSGRAAALLGGNGRTNVAVLDGGMLAWEAAGLLEAVEQ
ncbi:MAG: STAS domain-containing protein [Kouleothrix sp.]|nr:STAS domain-containing protein [Kouleothrix sp.]